MKKMKKWILTPVFLLIAAASSYAGSGGVEQVGSGSQSVQVTVPTAGTYLLVAEDAGGGIYGNGFAVASLSNIGTVQAYNGNRDQQSGAAPAGTYTASASVSDSSSAYAIANLSW
jgi:hypothetical protein